MSILIYVSSVLKIMASALKIGALASTLVRSIREFQGERVSPLALPDDDAMLLFRKFITDARREYFPTTADEEKSCKSLCNFGVLRQVNGGYKLTWENRHLASKT